MMKKILFLFYLLLLIPSVIEAQTSQFVIRTLVGEDNTPPTTPIISSTVPMSPYQVDIVWSASVDDVYVDGYRIYRDGVLLATTTQVSYIDTGLSPSTTYSYTVDAFDLALNFSSSSLPISTTTLAIPATTTATSSTSTIAINSNSQATAVPTLRWYSIDYSEKGAVINFTSYGPTRYELRFGHTSEYELGSVSSNIFGYEHVSRLLQLEPGTKYFIELSLYNSLGIKRVVKVDEFTTNAAITSELPASVSNVVGEIRNDDAVLSWTNPISEFRVIRVVRSHLFYPENTTDGVVVYEGNGTSFMDNNVFKQQEAYYYSIFVITEDGRVSAPAILLLEKNINGVDRGFEKVIPSSNNQDGHGSSTQLGKDIDDSGQEDYLHPEDIFVTYGPITQTFDSLTPLPIDTDVLVSIPYEAVPRHLKTILLSVYNPTDHNLVTTYLLKLRGDSLAYEANFHTSLVEGEGRLVVELFDYEHQSLRRVSRMVTYKDNVVLNGVWSVALGIFSDGFIWWWLLFILLLLFWLIFKIRRREDNR